ncbi:outer membrane protein assembly factor BamD [Arsenophonus symbiont of Ornithomya chloropus]|uniref:outer membrane protein assembly factor BamD n=1 Tax=Arsenophonus symbiont of Ornithomya chloropus TaxID=634121 RepID=UPI0032B17829
MKKKIKYLLIFITINLLIAGCSSNKNIISEASENDIYQSSQEKLKKHNYKGAIKLLEKLCSNYPLSVYKKKAQLDLIYAYYKSAEFFLAIKIIDRFILSNPNDHNIDYVLYMRGLNAQKLDQNILQDFFGIDHSDKDPQYAIAAFKSFTQLIHSYPNSFYVNNSLKHLFLIKERLAKYQLAIIKYYSKRGAYIAIINRTKNMLKQFPDSKYTQHALQYMKIAYNKLGLLNEKIK